MAEKFGKEVIGKAKDKVKGEKREPLLQEFNDFFTEVKSAFINRDTEIDQLKAALLLREHVLLRGRPGTAKSQLARTIFAHIGGKPEVFEIQFSKFMSEDYVFGPINIKKMRDNGIIEHNTTGSIVTADYAFIDEVFDGSDVLLRSLLEVLNERTFTRNAQKVKCNMRTAVLTSNFIREDESVEAFTDRIMFKSEVQPLEDRKDRMKMYKNYCSAKTNGIVKLSRTLATDIIDSLSEDLFEVEVDEDVLSCYDDVIKEFVKQTAKYISDRTANKGINLIRYGAIMRNSSIATADDIARTRDMFCEGGNMKDNEIFDAVFQKKVVQGREEILEMKSFRDEFGEDYIDRIKKKKYSPDDSMNDLSMLKAEKEAVKKLNGKMSEYQTPGAKAAINTLINEAGEDIKRLQKALSI